MKAIPSSPRPALAYLEKSFFSSILTSDLPRQKKGWLFAQMARLNTLYMIQRAGSGHLGSSFSSLDIVTWIYLNALGQNDRYYSSKGHDAPGLYSVQLALGILPFEMIHSLRTLGGLPGHPDVSTKGSHTNTGALGMGISKAKGFLYADQFFRKVKGHVFVMVGDGELQEGQFWESLLSVSREFKNRLTIVVDHNKIQSDTYVRDVSDLGDLAGKFRAFGLDTISINGHDYKELDDTIGSGPKNRLPDVIIANTIKGCGVSFLEHTAIPKNDVYYQYHSGALSNEGYETAKNELLENINGYAKANNLPSFKICCDDIQVSTELDRREKMIPAYSEAIVKEAALNQKIVALDADLVLDTGLIPFKERFPDRFVECGIAEQDMVSQAGTMALSGLIPMVHSFSCFLTSRASEQIYNNCTERSKIIYVGSLAGILPGGPGHSHQSVRDVTAMSARPGMTIIEPVNAKTIEPLVKWAVRENPGSTYLRLTSIAYPSEKIEKIHFSSTVKGRGQIIYESVNSAQIAIIATGPIMTDLALTAAEQLEETAIPVNVIATVWHNTIDIEWYQTVLKDCQAVITLENHFIERGFGSWFISELALSEHIRTPIANIIGIDRLPVCGTEKEVLEHHGFTINNIIASAKKMHKRISGNHEFHSLKKKS